LHCNIVFFDGFKAIEAIGGVHPNGIIMDKNERLAYCRSKYLCCYLMNYNTQSIRYHDLHNFWKIYNLSYLFKRRSYSQPTVRPKTHLDSHF